MIDERTANQRILIEIAEAMTRTTYRPLQQIELRYEAGMVILRGSVPTYFLKQLAQTTAMSVRGVHRVDNQLRVVESEQHRSERPIDSSAPISVHKTDWSCSRAVLAHA